MRFFYFYFGRRAKNRTPLLVRVPTYLIDKWKRYVYSYEYENKIINFNSPKINNKNRENNIRR